MTNFCFSLPGYIHLYRSLIRFLDTPSSKAKEMLYFLNTANLDSFIDAHPNTHITESNPVVFCRKLDQFRRPYRTEVQLYKSMTALLSNIDSHLIVSAQREAVQWLRALTGDVQHHFYKAYGIEIDDKRTVYSECAFRLVPREDEPGVCLIHEWIYLPSA